MSAYVVDLPNTITISKTFDVFDIYELKRLKIRTRGRVFLKGNDDDKILKSTWSDWIVTKRLESRKCDPIFSTT